MVTMKGITSVLVVMVAAHLSQQVTLAATPTPSPTTSNLTSTSSSTTVMATSTISSGKSSSSTTATTTPESSSSSSSTSDTGTSPSATDSSTDTQSSTSLTSTNISATTTATATTTTKNESGTTSETTTEMQTSVSTAKFSSTSTLSRSTSIVTSTQAPTSSRSTSTQAPTSSRSTSTQAPSSGSTSIVTSTQAPTSSGSTSFVKTSTAAPIQTVFVINEFTFTNLFSDTDFFVEIRRMEGSQNPDMTVVVLNGESIHRKCETVLKISADKPWTDDYKVTNSTLMKAPRQAVIVALYTDVDWVKCDDVNVTSTEAVDAMIVSQEPGLLAEGDTKIFVPMHASRVLIAKESVFSKGGPYSVTRCWNGIRDPGSFIVSGETRGVSNDCKVADGLNFSKQVKMTFKNAKCAMFHSPNLNKTVTTIVDAVVSSVGGECRCGLSQVLVKYDHYDCKMSTLFLSLLASSKNQEDLMLSQFTAFMNITSCVSMSTNSSLCFAPTCENCSHLPPGKSDKGNIKVTIGVVVACIAVFVIILVIVVLYIRKRRRGILQFRMTRLDEDDDDLMIAPDMDDFVGGTQDASFNNPMYSRFKT